VELLLSPLGDVLTPMERFTSNKRQHRTSATCYRTTSAGREDLGAFRSQLLKKPPIRGWVGSKREHPHLPSVPSQGAYELKVADAVPADPARRHLRGQYEGARSRRSGASRHATTHCVETSTLRAR
jgi:hypothetical protein